MKTLKKIIGVILILCLLPLLFGVITLFCSVGIYNIYNFYKGFYDGCIGDIIIASTIGIVVLFRLICIKFFN
jgi:hypothetical protein